VINEVPRPLYRREIDPKPILREAGWAKRPVWTGAEKLAPHWLSIPGEAVNGILPNCEVYILFRLLGVTESNVMPILKVLCLYVNVSVCSIRRAHVTVSSSEHWHSSEEYLAQKELYYHQIFIVQGFEHF